MREVTGEVRVEQENLFTFIFYKIYLIYLGIKDINRVSVELFFLKIFFETEAF